MPHNRLPQMIEEPSYRLPRPQVPAMTSLGFMACPLALLQGLSLAQQALQLAIYQMAFQQAQLINQPSILERDLLAVWN